MSHSKLEFLLSCATIFTLTSVRSQSTGGGGTNTLYGWDVVKWSRYDAMSAAKVYEGITSPYSCMALCVKVRANCKNKIND